MALSLFLSTKRDPASLETALFVATLPYALSPESSSFSVKACAILQAHRWSRQHHQDCHYFSLLSDSHFVLAKLSTSVLLFISYFLAGTTFYFLILRYQATMVLVSHFFQRMARPINWPGGVRCSSHPLSRVASFLLTLVSTLFFSRNGDAQSQQNSSTQKSPQYLRRNLCSLVTLTASSLVFAGTQLLLHSCFPKIKNRSCSAGNRPIPIIYQDTTNFILHAPATDSLRRSLFGDYSCPGLGELPDFWGSMVSRHVTISR